MWDNISKGDYGSIGKLQLIQDNAPVDISTYTNIEFIFQKQSGDIIIKTGSFDTDGNDGIVKYAFADGDLDEFGKWYVQVRISKTGVSITSEKLKFFVNDTID